MLDSLSRPENLIVLLVLVFAFAIALYFLFPLMVRNRLSDRIRAVSVDREKFRTQSRSRVPAADGDIPHGKLRDEPDAMLKSIVDRLNLRTALADENTELSLIQAGYRGQSPLLIFLTMRVVLPIIFMFIAFIIIFFVVETDYGIMARVGMAMLFGGGLGFYLPILFVRSQRSARQQSITQAWPDVLDLCLICVESGMPIEVAFRRVAAEIGSQSIPLAQELSLTTAELSYLQERRQAYNNFSERTGLEAVKNVMLSLLQAEKYGTPIASALRTLSQENREKRMSLAEKKAAALPPKLTVPMMLCFLPVLFCVILGPILIRVFDTFG